MVDIAEIYGAKRDVAESDMRDVLNFEIALAKVTISEIHFSTQKTIQLIT